MSIFRRKRADADLKNELESFIAEEAAENEAGGMSREEALRKARVKMGNSQTVRESLWTQNSFLPLTHLGTNLRYAFRTLRRSPGFSLIAIGVMALCMGATTSLFTIIRSVLLRPLAFRDPERLVMLYEHRSNAGPSPGDFYTPVAPAAFYDWRSKTNGFEDMAVVRYDSYDLTGEQGELPESLRAVAASWNLFPLLGVDPALGRTFSEPEDRRGSAVVIISWSLFQRRFHGDAAILGHPIHMAGRPWIVVGVLPSWFTWPDARIALWVPYQADAAPGFLERHDFHQSQVIARLRPDVSLTSALAQVSAVQHQLHVQYAPAPVSDGVTSRSLTEDLAGNVKQPLSLMMYAVACMLLIGCLNVANLIVARAAARQREMAIRSALGARRAVLIQEQLAESVLICLAGGVAGILLSTLATSALAHAWKGLPTAQSIHIDGAVIAFACLLMGAGTLIAGLLPALSATGKSILTTLQTSARTAGVSLSRTMLRKGLLTAEIAITVVLLVAAGLLLKSFERLRSVDVGAVTRNTLTLNYSLPAKRYGTPEKRDAFREALLERVRAVPGVQAAALGNTVPGAGYWGDFVYTIKDRPPLKPGENLPSGLSRWADPGYFSALGIPLISGRFFTAADRTTRADKIIISRQLAQQSFPGEDPIGRRLVVPANPHDDDQNNAEYEIVGVVSDTLFLVGQEPKPVIYFPLLAGTGFGEMLAIRTATDPLPFSLPIQRQIAALDPELAVSDIRTMDQVIGSSLVNASLSATLVAAFALLSLLLASVGLYGVLSYLATQRTTEIGVRMAMGARRDQLLRLMLFDGLRPALLGLALGLLTSLAATRLLQSLLYGTKPLDPAVLSVVVVTLLATAVLACLVPAWRATHLNPMWALRNE